MKYLFFDTEKSNSHKTDKVCEFGYVITDENFHVISAFDIPMSPGSDPSCRFDDLRTNRDKNFHFGYEQEEYFKCPEFPEYYSKIKKLLEDKDTIVFAFAAFNDVRALNETCDRYKLPRMHYRVYDVQIIYDYTFKDEKTRAGNQISLDKAYESVRYPHEMRTLDSHFSKDDAMMTMIVLQRTIEKIHFSVNEVITKLCPECECISFSKKFKNGVEFVNKPIKIKAGKNRNISNKAHALWNEWCKKAQKQLESGKYNHQRYTIWSSVKTDLDILRRVIKKFRDDETIVASHSVSLSDYIICMSEEDFDEIKKSLKHNYDGQLITIHDFLGYN